MPLYEYQGGRDPAAELRTLARVLSSKEGAYSEKTVFVGDVAYHATETHYDRPIIVYCPCLRWMVRRIVVQVDAAWSANRVDFWSFRPYYWDSARTPHVMAAAKTTEFRDLTAGTPLDWTPDFLIKDGGGILIRVQWTGRPVDLSGLSLGAVIERGT